MSRWDIALIVSVAALGAGAAYLRNPQHKAFVHMFPIPFSFAALSLGRPIDATNVAGIGAMLLFWVGIWLLHGRLRWPIVVVIPICGVGYCLSGTALASVLPDGDPAFWISVAGVLIASLLLIRLLPHREEPHYRTPLPVWVKLPAIVLVVIGIVALKQELAGFMTFFPMVGTITAYEARHSLWTIVCRIPWVMLLIQPMLIVMRLTQDHLGLGGALLVSWPVYLLCLWLVRARLAVPAAGPPGGGDGLRIPLPATGQG